MSKIFEHPYFVTPHAVDRFRERIADIPPAQVIEAVQDMLQAPGLPVDAEMRDGKLVLIYRGSFNGKAVYLPVVRENDKEWPIVPTVMGEECVIHTVLAHKKDLKSRQWRYSERKALIAPLRDAGFTIRQCAQILRLAHTTVERHLKNAGLTARKARPWTEQEKERLIRLYATGKSYDVIARKLGRSENAIKIALCRRRKLIRADPEKQQVLKVLSFCMNPNRILKLARDMGLLDELRRREEGQV
ncbi:MAG TPA: helix-turn-helix domain-containing protein [Firmicutes bacterium]|nr:helix-turn-helix domain-containing protein [Bacillota bacterium]